MKVLIQNTKTGKFLAKNGRWVSVEDQAADLFTLSKARLKTIKGRDMRAVLYFPAENGEPSIIIGAPDSPCGQLLPDRCRLTPLETPDTHYLRAAEGWYELGNPFEAGRELEQITPTQWAHPEVLKVRAKICFGSSPR
ncbi:MAG: hypothetical protein JWQ71_2705 [Pedosphaera sp.]|nr:hypothetical protein [Pedosphaera sp.]